MVANRLYPTREVANVEYRFLGEDEYSTLQQLGIVKRALAEMRLLVNKLGVTPIGTLFLPSGDLLGLGVWRYRRKLRTVRTVVVLLITPFDQIERYNPPTLMDVRRRLQTLRKRYAATLVGRVRNVRLGILNDTSSVARLNSCLKLARPAAYVPDPVLYKSYDPELNRSAVRSHPGGGPQTLLIIGTIDERKSVSKIAAWLQQLNAAKNLYTLRIVGRCASEALETKLRAWSEETPSAVSCKLEFVDLDGLRAEISAADVVLTLYEDLFCTSGILGHAAFLGTPVLAYEQSLIGDLIHAYQLGNTLDRDSDATGFAASLIALAQPDCVSRIRQLEYVRERTPQKFVEAIVNA